MPILDARKPFDPPARRKQRRGGRPQLPALLLQVAPDHVDILQLSPVLDHPLDCRGTACETFALRAHKLPIDLLPSPGQAAVALILWPLL